MLLRAFNEEPKAPTLKHQAAFNAACDDIYQCGFMTEPQEVAPGVLAASHTGHGFQAVAYELAKRLPGQLWPGRRSVSWVCGPDGPHGRLIEVDDIPKLRGAQDALADLGILASLANPWSVGRMARHILRWVVPPQKVPAATDHLIEGIEIGYHDCVPGEYEHVTMYDVRACYHSLLRFAPSPKVLVSRKGGVTFGALSASEHARWQEMLTVVGDEKVLRNSLVGCAMGTRVPRRLYVRNAKRPTRPIVKQLTLPPGEYRGLGLLVIRSAYELCLLASLQSGSIYSTIDSVTIAGTTNQVPPVWSELGLNVEVKASGKAHIVRRGCWQIGPKQTDPYKAGFRGEVSKPRAELPARLYNESWLPKRG